MSNHEITDDGFLKSSGIGLFFATPGYLDLTVELVKIDTGLTGVVNSGNAIFATYQYPALLQLDGATRIYAWLIDNGDGGLVAHEFVTGAAMSFGGSGGISQSSVGAPTYRPKHNMNNPSASVTQANSGVPIAATENAGGVWSWDGWLFRNASAAHNIYTEYAAGLTSFFTIDMDATGHLRINHTGAIAFTSTHVTAVGVWEYHALTYDGTNIRHYVNGVLQGAATAYTRTVYAVGATTINLDNAGFYTTNIAAYPNVTLTQDQINGHYNFYNASNWFLPSSGFSSSTNLQQNVGVTCYFGSGFMGIASPSNGLMHCHPLYEQCMVSVGGGTFYYRAKARLVD